MTGRARFEANEVVMGRIIKGRVLWDGQKYRFVDVQERWLDWQAAEADALERAAKCADVNDAERMDYIAVLRSEIAAAIRKLKPR